MVNCEICPIRAECEEIKYDHVNEASQDMQGYVHNTMDYCPLVVMISQDLNKSLAELYKV